MMHRAQHARQFAARLVTRLLYRVNVGDISIRNHWTGDVLQLHSFKHRSYWFHGRRREADILGRLPLLIRPGDLTIDVGGHIGYITQILSRLVGESGQVVVIEPGANNLPYLQANTRGLPNVRVIPKAASDKVCMASFFLEDLSGQNNSLLSAYQSFKNNCDRLGADQARVQEVRVDCTTLDAEFADGAATPALVKIDVEGAELFVLQGMENLLRRSGIVIMLEVTSNPAEVWQLLTRHSFQVYSPLGRLITHASQLQGNVFCIKQDDPRIAVIRGNGSNSQATSG
jgi:FkbM family methyltransferase